MFERRQYNYETSSVALRELAKKGYQDDYSLLLNIICFISLPIDIDNKEFIKENLLN